MTTKIQVFAVFRIDDDLDLPDAITIVKVLSTRENAQSETDRLNALNGDKGCSYHWQATRYIPDTTLPSLNAGEGT